MSVVLAELRKRNSPDFRPWHAVIARAPDDISDTVDIVVPEFTEQTRWTNVKWQRASDVALPAVGDPCLVLRSNRGEPWVVAWWPF